MNNPKVNWDKCKRLFKEWMRDHEEITTGQSEFGKKCWEWAYQLGFWDGRIAEISRSNNLDEDKKKR